MLSLTVYSCSMLCINAFQSPGMHFGIQRLEQQKQVLGARVRVPLVSLAASSKEEEIAALEEQLQRLKEEASKEEEEEVEAVETVSSTGGAVIDRKSMNDELMPEMLTEQWKEANAAASDDANEGGIMKTLTSLLGGLALLAGVIAFSQVPVGQEDLNKYSTGKAGANKIDLGDMNTIRSSDF